MPLVSLLCLLIGGGGSASADPGVFLRFYNGRTVDEFRDVPSEDFDDECLGEARGKTVIYAHGFGEALGRGSAKLMAQVFLLRREEMFVALGYMEEPIPVGEAVARVSGYARELSRAVTCLLRRGVHVHLVGYSLGANVMAQVGKKLSERHVLVPRITGLDPAGNVVPVELSLDPSYAEMVDVIHTDAGAFGFAPPCGTVDFYPNVGVSSQPGCFEEKGLVKVENLTRFLEESFEASPLDVPTLSLCSHERSWRFFAETVLRPNSFPATKKFGRPGCRAAGDIHAYMGLATPHTATGCYFLNTDEVCPFGRDLALDEEELATLCWDS